MNLPKDAKMNHDDEYYDETDTDKEGDIEIDDPEDEADELDDDVEVSNNEEDVDDDVTIQTETSC